MIQTYESHATPIATYLMNLDSSEFEDMGLKYDRKKRTVSHPIINQFKEGEDYDPHNDKRWLTDIDFFKTNIHLAFGFYITQRNRNLRGLAKIALEEARNTLDKFHYVKYDDPVFNE